MTASCLSLAVVVLNYNGWHDTIECLASLLKYAPQNARLIVVDNCSWDDSVSKIVDWFHSNHVPFRHAFEQDLDDVGGRGEHLIVEAACNGGYAVGNNIGIRCALAQNADLVMILNNDTIANQSLFDPIVRVFASDENALVAGPLIHDESGNVDPSCARRRPSLLDYFFRMGFGKWLWPSNPWRKSPWYLRRLKGGSPLKVDVISGACMVVRAAFLRRIGLLDPRTFLFAEEYILAEQVRQANGSTYVVPASTLVHKHGKSIQTQPGLQMQQHLITSHEHYLRNYRRIGAIGRLIRLAGPRLQAWIAKKRAAAKGVQL